MAEQMTRKMFTLLLRLLPAEFRGEYEQEIEVVVADHWRAVKTRGSWLAFAGFWIRQAAAIVRLSFRLRAGLGARGTAWRAAGTTTSREGMMMGLAQDLRHAVRGLLKQPGFALITVGTLGLGIGASTAIFSAVHAVLFRPLAYADVDRVVAIFHTDTEERERSTGASAANVRDLDEAAERLEFAAVAEPWSLDLLMDDRTESLRTWSVSPGFFDVLTTAPALGRTFLPEEYEEGKDRVVVLGHRSWINHFSADPGVVGRTVPLDGVDYTVVGVLPPAFKYPDRAAAWIPRPPKPWDASSRAADYMAGVGRLAPGATLAQAQAEVDRIAVSLGEQYPSTNASTGLSLVPFREHLFGNVRTPLLVLLSAVAFVLLIVCANVAGLMLARGAAREREYAVRGALGAGRARLARSIVAESFLLALVGCALGVALTVVGVGMIQGLGPDHLPRIDELSIDGSVLAFAVAVSGLSAFLAGLAPALRLSRPDLQQVLSDGSRGIAGRRGASRIRDRLVVAEIAAALVLLIGAGLLTRSFTLLIDEELGFQPADRVAVQMFPNGYPEGELQVFMNQVMENMLALPGVQDVSLTSTVPGATDGTISNIDIDLPFRIEGHAAPPQGQEPIAWIAQVSSGYFDVMEIPVVEGRGFTLDDRSETAPVLVVNEALARRYFPEGDVIGQRIRLPWGRPDAWLPREIVGVIGDVRPMGFESEPRPEVFFPLSQVGTSQLTLVLATTGEAESLVLPAMEAIWAANPAQSVWGAATLESLLADWLKERRFNLVLFSSFAVIAMLLSAVGIYGLISFSVEQRVSELGLRRALGGQTSAVLGMMLREGARLAGSGIVVGVVLAAALTRFLSGMLFGVEPMDWPTFALLALAVLVITSLATLVPAIRATRVDPLEALREG